MGVSSLVVALRRCKSLSAGAEASQLSRCLQLVDLAALAVGSTLGLGAYVLAGAVAKTLAGPAVVLSFLIAAVVSVFSGICYTEFAIRVPKAGSAYVYSYVSVGEFVAFTIGWNLVLEYVLGAAGTAKGLANYIDMLCGNTMQTTMAELAPINVSFLAGYPDFLAFGIVLAVTVILAYGVKETARFNNVFISLNLSVIAVVIVAGSFYCDPANWRIKPEDIPEEHRAAAGAGGFMPFGLAGVMAGAAKCFFGFIGFDCLATCGEEAKNPKRDIPLAIFLSLIIIFVVYCSLSVVLTMMCPYYSQSAEAPFPHVFDAVGLPVVKWLVTVGAVFALLTSLIGAMFPLPRIIYAMGSDGVIFRPLAKINERTKTPFLATIVSGLFAATLAMIFNINQLIDMMSIGTLLAYTIVATSVLVLRYEADPVEKQYVKEYTEVSVMKQLFNITGLKDPTVLSSTIAKVAIVLFVVMSLLLCFVIPRAVAADPADPAAAAPGVLGAALLLLAAVLARQPRTTPRGLAFRVPLVPLLPLLSVFMNVFLMAQLDAQTWVRFVVWLAIGYLIYFLYGVKHSSLADPPQKDIPADNDLTCTK